MSFTEHNYDHTIMYDHNCMIILVNNHGNKVLK